MVPTSAGVTRPNQTDEPFGKYRMTFPWYHVVQV